MKRYVSLILICVGTIILMTALFYFLLRQDNYYITYIKLQVNPSFVIGIDEKKNVVFYNALNEDGNKYNLSMFQGKSLEEATRIFIEKLGIAKENKDEINLTVMTKNNILEKEIADIISNVIKGFDNNYQIILHEPTNDELEKYSDETIYNISPSINDETLKLISKDIYDKINNHIDKKINNLHLKNLNKEDRVSLLKEKQEEGYFSDYILSNIKIDEYNVTLLEKSNYSIIFTYDEENNYTYRIVLNLEIEKEKNEIKRIVEVYIFSYEEIDNIGKINDLKRYFYSF